ncbi:hypothetical protein [Kitasatospora sp. GP82]|nr:hypothetical protein [Kitasatospora sp. GP82]MDH6129409.1 hypothetical protein [Kitasatospora sp. GP82]
MRTDQLHYSSPAPATRPGPGRLEFPARSGPRITIGPAAPTDTR